MSIDDGKLQILLVCNALGMGGTERNVMLHARELSRLGHDVRIHPLVVGGVLDDECSRWMDARPGGGSDAKRVEQRLARHVEEWRPHIVHALGSPADVLAAVVCMQVPGSRFVFALQDRKPMRERGTLRAMHWAMQLADLTIPDGEGTRCQAVEEIGSPPERTWTLVDGVDIDGLGSVRSRCETRAELGADGDQLLVGMVARLDLPKKGQDILLDAVSLIQAPHARYVLVGDGDAVHALHNQALELGIADRVHFAGTRSDLGDVISALDIAVMSSRWESIPKSLLEKMALGRPIVTTDAGDIPEVARNEENALVVPTDNAAALAGAIERLLFDAQLRSTLGEAARASIHEAGLTLRSSVCRLAEKYAEIVRASPREDSRSMIRWMTDRLGMLLARRQLRVALPYMRASVAADAGLVAPELTPWRPDRLAG